MRYTLTLFLTLIFLTEKAHAQANDSIAVHFFANRGLATGNVQFNAISVIPELYKENKTDTLNAVLKYWEHTERMSEPLFSYLVIDEIKNYRFSEHLCLHDVDSSMYPNGTDYYKAYIVLYLQKYLDGCNISKKPHGYQHHKSTDKDINTYSQYYIFLQSIALSITEKLGLTPAESFLIHFYAQPDSGRFYDLRSSLYKNTLLRDAALHKGIYSKNSMVDVGVVHGVHLEVNTGVWFYTGNIRALQSVPEPTIGFKLGGRSNKFSYDFSCDLHWATTPKSFIIHTDSLYSTRYNGAGYLGIDCGYQLYRKNRTEIVGLGGAGYSVFDVGYDGTKSTSYHSPDINMGLGYKYYFRHRAFDDREVFDYLTLEAKYHFLFYDNPAATPIDGNAFSLTLAIGAYSTSRFAFDGNAAKRGVMNAMRRN